MTSPSRRASLALVAAATLLLSLSAGLAIAANGSVSIVESNGKYSYSPANLTVEQGTKVKWTNNGDAAHTVTADDSSFQSDSFGENATFEQTFNTVGQFGYHCEIHDYMHAKVTVVASTSSQPPTDTVVDAGARGGSAVPWLSILAAGATAIVFGVLGQRALVARKRSQ
jgi:plastocyanin